MKCGKFDGEFILKAGSAVRRKKLKSVKFGLKSTPKSIQNSCQQDPKNYTDAVCDDVEQAKIAVWDKWLRYFYLDAVS